MQSEDTAQASLGSIFNIRLSWHRVMKRSAFQKPMIDAMTLKSWKSAVLSLSFFVALISASGPTVVAQTGNVVISTSTTWATGAYNLTSLAVEDGATLTIGGGSTVTVSGAVLVTANSSVVLQ